jgi:hypothetical protein
MSDRWHLTPFRGAFRKFLFIYYWGVEKARRYQSLRINWKGVYASSHWDPHSRWERHRLCTVLADFISWSLINQQFDCQTQNPTASSTSIRLRGDQGQPADVGRVHKRSDGNICIKWGREQRFVPQVIFKCFIWLWYRMACIDYMTNFYNDANFRTDGYAHFLGDVIQMCNHMIKETYTQNTEILNDILELYRFIVEKYASHAS